MLDWPMHLSGQREPYLELFAQVGLREEHNENSADLLASCEDRMPGVLTACGQTNAFTHADSPSEAAGNSAIRPTRCRSPLPAFRASTSRTEQEAPIFSLFMSGTLLA
jgi:hypothetical protein